MGIAFAPDYKRDEHGWILFPRDLTDRRKLVPSSIQKDVSLHPAKMNLYLCQEIIKAFTKPDDTILDPFAGVGTTMVAARMDRNVILLELEQHYCDLIRATWRYWLNNEDNLGYKLGLVTLVQGDNRQILPLPCDHIITSPPYGSDLAKSEKGSGALTSKEQTKIDRYTGSSLNIGHLNPFLYNQTMIKVYKLMITGLRSGGTITITHRDRLRGTERILYARDIMKTMSGLGCDLTSWEKWKAPGSIQSRVNEKKGVESILDEDILSFQKQ